MGRVYSSPLFGVSSSSIAEQLMCAVFATVGYSGAISAQTVEADAEPKTLGRVEVFGDRSQSFSSSTVQAGSFRDQDPLDVPLTNNVITREVIDAQGARSLYEALRNTAGVTLSQLSSSVYDNISIRGIAVENRGNYRLNGTLPIINLIAVPLEDKERVEVLKGVSSLYYGLVPPSGIVNYVTKRAGSKPVTSFTTSLNDHGGFDGHLDVGRRFGDQDSMGIRVNLAAGKEETGIERSSGDRNLASLAYDWRVSSRLNIKFDFEHYSKDVTEQAAIALPTAVGGVITLPNVPENTLNLGDEWMHSKASATNYLLRGDLSLNDAWILSLETGRAENERDRRFSQFQNYSLATGNGTLRIFFADGQSYVNTNHRVELSGRFDTGSVNHALTFGATRNEREQESTTSPFVNVSQNLYNPVSIAEISAPAMGSSASNITDKGVYVFDQMSLDRWQLMVGARSIDYESISSRAQFAAKDVAYSTSVLYKWTPNISVYGSYIEGPEESGQAPAGRANAGEILPPAVAKQKEIGVKARINSNLLLQGAYFDIQRALTIVDASNRFALGGESTYRGVELSASGEVGRNWALIASALFLDAEITRVGTANPGELGKTPENTPDATYSLFAEYRVPEVQGWAVNGGAYYVGKRPVNNLNQAYIDSYTTFSFGTRYLTKVNNIPMTLQANLDNAFNKNYWSTASNGLLAVGAPRTLRVAAKFDF